MKKVIIIVSIIILMTGCMACAKNMENTKGKDTDKWNKEVVNNKGNSDDAFVNEAEDNIEKQKKNEKLDQSEAVVDKKKSSKISGVPVMKSSTVKLEPFLVLPDERAFSVDFNQKGKMYIVCAPPNGNGTLYQVTTTGEKKEICEVEGTFIGPGMAINQNNDIYITTGTKLNKYKIDGTYETVASGFKNAWDVTLDNNNNIYVSDELEEAVYRITPSGDKKVIIASDKKTGKRFMQGGIEYNPVDECLYVVYNFSIYKYSLASDNIMETQELIYKSPEAIRLMTIDNKGNLFVDQANAIVAIEHETNKLFMYKIDGNFTNFIGLNFGKGEFNKEILYITTDKNISKFIRK